MNDNTLEVSASEINLLCRKISSSIDGYSVSSVYSIEGGILLRLRHETKEERLIAISSFATWITSKNLSLEHAEQFVSRIRDLVERTRLVSVYQEGSERIATFVFQARTGERLKLHAEFFGGGNIVLANGEDEEIIDAKKAQHFRHRVLVPGEKYVLPPSRGRNLEQIDGAFLNAEIEKTKSDPRSKGISAIQWFGRLVATSRKFVEEIFFRSGVKPDVPATSLTSESTSRLSEVAHGLIQEIEGSGKGFLLVPSLEDVVNGKVEEVDACALVPDRWKVLKEKGLAEIQEYPSFNDTLDEAQVQSLLLGKKAQASKEIRSKAEELESAIRKQDALLERNGENAKELRRLAGELMMGAGAEASRDLIERLESMNVLEKDRFSRDELRFVHEPRAFLSSFSTPRALSSRLFDEAKALEETNRSVISIRENLIKRKDALMEQSRISEDRALKRVVAERRARQWFERYRWFLTSDGRLAIGGRDSTSNSVVINKYADQSCIIFHADLFGSPFFLLKNARSAGTTAGGEQTLALDQEIEQELAQATASFSRAWRDELGSADAYWVFPEQIKKSAPSGEYLPRGSFFIEGKKNFVKHMRIELCVGIMLSDKLHIGESGDADKISKEHDEDNEERASEQESYKGTAPETVTFVVVCGPERALEKYCVSRLKIAPGKEKSSTIARRIKQLLVSNMREDAQLSNEIKELAKKIAIDDIIRVLPSGSYKIVAEKQIVRKQNG